MFISQKPLNNSDCFFKQRLHAHARAFVIRRYVNAQLISETTSSRRTVTTSATMTQKTFERVIAIITKPSHLRRRHEIETVLPWLRKKSSLLQHADDSEWASFLMRTKTHPVKLLETVHDNYEQRGTLWTSALCVRSWSIRVCDRLQTCWPVWLRVALASNDNVMTSSFCRVTRATGELRWIHVCTCTCIPVLKSQTLFNFMTSKTL